MTDTQVSGWPQEHSDEHWLFRFHGCHINRHHLYRTIRIFNLKNSLLTFIIDAMNRHDVAANIN